MGKIWVLHYVLIEFNLLSKCYKRSKCIFFLLSIDFEVERIAYSHSL